MSSTIPNIPAQNTPASAQRGEAGEEIVARFDSLSLQLKKAKAALATVILGQQNVIELDAHHHFGWRPWYC